MATAFPEENIPLLENEKGRDDWAEEEAESSSINDDNISPQPITSLPTVQEEDGTQTSTPLDSKIRQQWQSIVRQKLSMIYRLFEKEDLSSTNPYILDSFSVVEENDVPILKFKKGGKWVDLTKKDGLPRSKQETIKRFGGIQKLKQYLNLGDDEIPIERNSKRLDKITPTEIEMQAMSSEQIVDIISEIEPNLKEMGTNTDIDMREVLALDKALQRIQTELTNNLSKLSEVNEKIARQKRKLTETDDPNMKERISKRLEDAKVERDARLEVVAQNKKSLSSQFARIRQTMEQILEGDRTFAEKVKLVFREQGLTIAAVLTALGLAIQAIVSALTGGVGDPPPPPPPPKHPNKVIDWVKKQLSSLGRLLGRLAGKAAAALPGIIGAIVSGVLNFLKKAVFFAADHVWAFIVSCVMGIAYALFQKPNRRKKHS